MTGFPLSDTPGLSDRALIVFFRLADAAAGGRAVEDVLSRLRDRAVLATDVSFTISDPALPDNPLVWVNPAFSRITGYSFEEVAGRNCRFLQGPATDRARSWRSGRRWTAHESITVTLVNYRKDGTAFWNEVSMSPVFDGRGDVTNFVGVQADVTARVQAEAEREEAYRAAERAQSRLAVLAGVSAALSTTLDVGEALHRMAAELVPAFADWCAVDLAEPQAVRRVAVAHKDPTKVAALRAVPPTAGVRATVVSTVLSAGQPQLVAEIDDALLAELAGPPERLALLREVGVTSGMVVPLRAAQPGARRAVVRAGRPTTAGTARRTCRWRSTSAAGPAWPSTTPTCTPGSTRWRWHCSAACCRGCRRCPAWRSPRTTSPAPSGPTSAATGTTCCRCRTARSVSRSAT